MRKAKCALAVALLVFGAACSGGPTNPETTLPVSGSDISLTSEDVSFVAGTDVVAGLTAAGTVMSVRFESSLGISGPARGRWEMSAAKEGDGHRVDGELRLRARTADDQEIGVSAQIRRAALRDDGEAMRFAAVARVQYGGVGYPARLRGTIIDDGRIRLQFFFRDGGEGQIVGRVETFEVR